MYYKEKNEELQYVWRWVNQFSLANEVGIKNSDLWETFIIFPIFPQYGLTSELDTCLGCCSSSVVPVSSM